ncbi:MAG: hypothetical protein RJA37_615 [Verrucomicrobiota bacterium]
MRLGDSLSMPARRGRAGTHTTVIEAAVPVVRLLEARGRVSRGMIEAGIGARARSVKVRPLPGGLRVTVVSKGSRQELHVYGITPDEARALLTAAALPGYVINFSDA